MASCHAWNQPSGNVAVEKEEKKKKKKTSMRGCEQESGCHGDAVTGQEVLDVGFYGPQDVRQGVE